MIHATYSPAGLNAWLADKRRGAPHLEVAKMQNGGMGMTKDLATAP
ncbi:MAG: hypothetical protein IPK97_16675 [Ahniella sp.]|nr:hypothetical protein [Ahniella sp.]